MKKFKIKRPRAALLILGAVVALGIGAMSMNIKQIRVSGNNRYTGEELVDMIFKTKADRNTLYCYGKDKLTQHQQIPFVEDYELVFQGLGVSGAF